MAQPTSASGRRALRLAYERRVFERLDQINRLEDRAVRRVARIAGRLAVAIRGRMARAGAVWDLRVSLELSAGIKRMLDDFARETSGEIAEFLRRAAALGERSRDDLARTLGIEIKPAPLAPRSLAVLQAVTSDLVQAVSDRAHAKIDEQIRRVATGVQNPFDAMRAISDIVARRRAAMPGVPAFQGSLVSQTERIVRTETNRVFNVEHFEGLQAAREVLPDLRKRWLAVLDDRTRDSHRDQHEETVGMDELFSNGLRFPLDPAGPPEETINCRCRLIAYRQSWTRPKEEQAATQGLEELVAV